jgi:hypothetical protein
VAGAGSGVLLLESADSPAEGSRGVAPLIGVEVVGAGSCALLLESADGRSLLRWAVCEAGIKCFVQTVESGVDKLPPLGSIRPLEI